jgi:hypothetical protein
LAEAPPAPLRVLAVAESDAYVKWAAWTLERLRPSWDGELTVLRSPIAPSDRQIADAVVGTQVDASGVGRTDLIALRRRLRRDRVDVLLLACTGPSILAIGAVALPERGPHRPVVVSGLPGVALPIHRRAIRARRDTDVFVAHSRRERAEYQAAFDAEQLPVRVALARLPFLASGHHPPGRQDGPVVFAAQPSVPPEREERLQLLRRLAALAPPPPIVKLRTQDSESATHNEPWPYPDLWTEIAGRHEVRGSEVEFLAGPLEPVLERARCLVTVSSTAALEAIARGVPVLLVDDLGLDERLLNGMFAGSDLFGPLDRNGVAAAGPPAEAWRDENYFHLAQHDDLVGQVRDATGERRTGTSVRRVRRRGLQAGWTTARRTIRLLTARRGTP